MREKTIMGKDFGSDDHEISFPIEKSNSYWYASGIKTSSRCFWLHLQFLFNIYNMYLTNSLKHCTPMLFFLLFNHFLGPASIFSGKRGTKWRKFEERAWEVAFL